jgi:5-methylcytosine-specific restriction endonuclease McrA
MASEYTDKFFEDLAKVLLLTTNNKHKSIDVEVLRFLDTFTKKPTLYNIKQALDASITGVKSKYFKIETFKWNMKPLPYTLENLTSYTMIELANFSVLRVAYIKLEKPIIVKAVRPPITQKLRFETWCIEGELTDGLKYKGKPFSSHTSRLCFTCLKEVSFVKYDTAHIVPYANGGEDKIRNLRISCEECNRGSGGMSTHHAYEWAIQNKKPGVKYFHQNDPNFTTALALRNLHFLCDKVVSADEMPSFKDPISFRLIKYTEILSRKMGLKQPEIPVNLKK